MGRNGGRDVRHGMSRTPEYRAWSCAKQRCLNPNWPAFADYGGRGISMHAAWIDSFVEFIGAIGARPSPLHSLDRIDNTKGYEPGNVRWATRQEQQQNQRGNSVNERTVRVIRELRAAGNSQKSIARALGLPTTTVRYVAQGKTWSNLPGAIAGGT